MTAICYNRFRIATRSPDNQRRILRWLFRNFMVYEFDVSDATACGRFMVPGPAFEIIKVGKMWVKRKMRKNATITLYFNML